MIPAYVYGFLCKDYHTEAFGTVIDEEIPAQNGMRLALLEMEYLCGGTAHLASFMYAKDPAATPGSCRNRCDTPAVSGQKVLNVVTTPTDPAGNAVANLDIIAWQLPDGTWEYGIIASVASEAITMTGNIQGVDAGAGAVAVEAGARVMIFGAIADGAVMNVSLTASVVTRKGQGHLTIVHPYMSEPFYLSIDNGTAAGFLEHLVMGYINK